MRRALLTLMPALACASSAPPVMPPSSPNRLLGEPAPSFARSTVNGDRFDTASAAGRVLLVELFADYCRPCLPRLVAAERLARAHRDLVVVALSLDETPDLARRQAARLGLSYAVVHDAGHGLAGKLRVSDLPAAFLVGRDGRVIWVGGPEQPPDALERATRAALAAPR